MSNSIKLRKIISEHPIQNFNAIQQQYIVERAMQLTKIKLKKRYKNNSNIFDFQIEKNVDKTKISEKLKKANSKCGLFISNFNSFISPDAGFLYCYIYGHRYCILSAEAKKQGTNKDRIKEGLPMQSLGNAVERASKNLLEIKNILRFERCFPYVIFFSGCDFKEGSSIRDRITAMNFMRPFNKIEVERVIMRSYDGLREEQVPSVFVREKQWSIREVFDIFMKISNKSIKIYLNEEKKEIN